MTTPRTIPSPFTLQYRAIPWGFGEIHEWRICYKGDENVVRHGTASTEDAARTEMERQHQELVSEIQRQILKALQACTLKEDIRLAQAGLNPHMED